MRQRGCIHCFVNLLRADRETGMQIGKKRQWCGHFQVALIRNSRIENVGNYPIDKVIKATRTRVHRLFLEKDLDTIAIDTLYKTVRAMDQSRTVRTKISMLMSRTHREDSTKWQPCAATYGSVVSLGLTLSATNIFGGKLGRETSIDSRQYKI